MVIFSEERRDDSNPVSGNNTSSAIPACLRSSLRSTARKNELAGAAQVQNDVEVLSEFSTSTTA